MPIDSSYQTPNKKPRTIRYMNDFSAEHFTAPQYYEKFKKLSNEYKSKIKCLQVKNSRLEKKVESLKELLCTVQKLGLISEDAANNVKVKILN